MKSKHWNSKLASPTARLIELSEELDSTREQIKVLKEERIDTQSASGMLKFNSDETPQRTKHTDFQNITYGLVDKVKNNKKIERLETGLKHVIEPLTYLYEQAQAEGHQLSHQAYEIATDPMTAKRIALEALDDAQRL
jgi:hypothetical protein